MFVPVSHYFHLKNYSQSLAYFIIKIKIFLKDYFDITAVGDSQYEHFFKGNELFLIKSMVKRKNNDISDLQTSDA